MTSAVQPVWWLAPSPRPVSPWKYSWNEQEILPVRIGGEARLVPVAGAPSVLVGQEEIGRGVRRARGDLLEVHELAGAGRTFHLQAVAVEVVVALQRLDQQVVHREPDRARASSSCRRTGRVVDSPGS